MLCNRFLVDPVPGGSTVLRKNSFELAELGDYVSAGVGLSERTAFFLSVMVESEGFLCNQHFSVTGKPLNQ